MTRRDARRRQLAPQRGMPVRVIFSFLVCGVLLLVLFCFVEVIQRCFPSSAVQVSSAGFPWFCCAVPWLQPLKTTDSDCCPPVRLWYIKNQSKHDSQFYHGEFSHFCVVLLRLLDVLAVAVFRPGGAGRGSTFGRLVPPSPLPPFSYENKIY